MIVFILRLLICKAIPHSLVPADHDMRFLGLAIVAAAHHPGAQDMPIHSAIEKQAVLTRFHRLSGRFFIFTENQNPPLTS